MTSLKPLHRSLKERKKENKKELKVDGWCSVTLQKDVWGTVFVEPELSSTVSSGQPLLRIIKRSVVKVPKITSLNYFNSDLY